VNLGNRPSEGPTGLPRSGAELAHPVWDEGFTGPALESVRTSRLAALEQAVLLVGLAARGSVTLRPDDHPHTDLAELGGNVLALASEFEEWLTAPAENGQA
jgi:hypothetical protein